MQASNPQARTKEVCWSALTSAERPLVEKILHSKERLSPEEGRTLFDWDLSLLGVLADEVNRRVNQDEVYFNRNFHIEPTNVCVFSCKFCSYSRLYAHREEGWELSLDEMMATVKAYDHQPITEVHIVGGVHPKMNLDFFCTLIERIKAHRPSLHVKGFSAVELDYMFRKAKLSVEAGLKKLKASGLESMPGGGAEIFNAEIRQAICEDKVDAEGWLLIHETAHRLGIPSNATMLYGHIERYEHRIEHMEMLRSVQDKTQGFNTFIPLKFLNQNNEMSHIPQVSVVEDLKMYAVARLFMDNFKHIKAYWPMIGKSVSQLSLSFGVDDLDGTIDDSTKIYAMAGAEEQHPSLSTEELVEMIRASHKQPVERDSVYRVVHRF